MNWRALVDSVLPRLCLGCDGPLSGERFYCAPCTAALPWNRSACPGCALPSPTGSRCAACLQKPRAFDAAFAGFTLQAPIQQGIHQLKYHADFRQAHSFAALLADTLAVRTDPLPERLLPVPLHWRRQWWRGYNQSIEIARPLARALGLALDVRSARRIRPTEDQLRLTAAERRQALRAAFAIGPGVAGRHIAFVDDVMTTGATFEALARAAKAAGAARVEVWAVARTPLRR